MKKNTKGIFAIVGGLALAGLGVAKIIKGKRTDAEVEEFDTDVEPEEVEEIEEEEIEEEDTESESDED